MKNIIAFLLVAASFFSCRKSDLDKPSLECRVNSAMFKHNGQEYPAELIYDSLGNLISMNNLNISSHPVISYSYDGQGRILKTQFLGHPNNDFLVEYVWQGSEIKSIHTYQTDTNGNKNLLYTEVPVYSGKHIIQIDKSFAIKPDTVVKHTDFVYDGRGNCIQSTVWTLNPSGDTTFSRYTYTYDNTPGSVFLSWLFFSPYITIKNNLSSTRMETSEKSNGNWMIFGIIDYDLDYRPDGYVSSLIVHDNILELQYGCK